MVSQHSPVHHLGKSKWESLSTKFFKLLNYCPTGFSFEGTRLLSIASNVSSETITVDPAGGACSGNETPQNLF